MKLFKRIYYPILGVLLVAALVLGFVDATVGGAGKTDAAFVSAATEYAKQLTGFARGAYDASGKTNAAAKVYSNLYNNGFSSHTAYTDTNGYDTASIEYEYVKALGGAFTEANGYKLENGYVVDANGNRMRLYKPTVTRVTSALLPETVEAMDGIVPVGYSIANVIAYVPGTDTNSGKQAETLVLTARYDAVPGSESASWAASAGSLMKLAMDTAKSGGYKNDIVFLFTEGGESNYGVWSFAKQFKGFNNVAERVGLVGEFIAQGDSNTITMYAGGNAAVLGKYTSVNKSGFMSSAVNKLLNLTPAGGAFDAPAVSVGDAGTANPTADTFANLSQSCVKRQAGVVNRFLSTYGSADLAALDSDDGAVFFSYLNLMTVVYPKFVSYIFGGIILALMAAIIAVNVKRKSFSFSRSAVGLLTQLLTVLATVLSLFVAYYVVGLLCAGFGAFNIHAINTLLYSNVGLIVGVMLLSLALSAAFNTVLKKAFFIKAPDAVRGNAWLWAIVGAVMSFAAPELGYAFAFGAILELVVMLLVTIFKDKYRDKFHSDIERLFLYVTPYIFILPMAASFITAATSSVRLLFLPLLMIPFLMMAGSITPYASYLVPVFDRAAKKLPKRKIRVQRTVEVEKVDPAKPGKKGEIVQEKKVFTEKIDWNYRNWFGITAVSVVAVLVMVLSSVFGGSVNANAGTRFAYSDALYDNAITYVWSQTDGGVTKQVVIKDTDAYKYFSKYISGYAWDAERKAYVKTVYDNDVIIATPSISFSNGVYTVAPSDAGRSAVRMTVTGASAVTSFVFTKEGEEDEFTVENNGKDTVEIVLPYSYGNFTMKTEGTTAQLRIQYVEYRPDTDSSINNLGDWLDLKAAYADNAKVAPYLRAAIIYEYNF